MVAAAVIVTIAGITLTLMQSSALTDVRAELDSEAARIKTLVGRRHLPDPKNIQALSDNAQKVDTVLESLKPVLQSPENRLGSIKEQEANDFKQQLQGVAEKLRADAKSLSVQLPEDFYFGFGRYRKTIPKKKDTPLLERQLVGIEQITSILLNTGITKIESISRSFDEDAELGHASGGSSRSSGPSEPEQVKGRSVVHSSQLYVTYPFEFEFIGVTSSLQKFINELSKSPYLFTVRSFVVTSLKPVPPRMDELEKHEEPARVNPATGLPQVRAGARPPRFVLGEEKLRIRVWIDLIEWKGISTEVASENPAQPPPTKKKPR